MDKFAEFLLSNQDSFRQLAAGVPTIIAFFLIVFAHRTLAQRLKEASEAGFGENANAFRRFLYGVWGVALVLIMAHGWMYVSPVFLGGKHTYTGYIDNLTDNASVRFSGVERHYTKKVRAETGLATRTEWVVMHNQALSTLSFDVVFADDFVLRCRMVSTLDRGSDMYLTAFYSGEGENSLLAIEKLEFEPEAPTCNPLATRSLAPSRNAPVIDVGDGEPQDDARLERPRFELIRSAFAKDALPAVDLNVLRKALESDVYDVRHQARKTLLEHYSQYSGWVEAVAANPSRATDREIGAITWVLSRRRAQPWEDLSMEPDVAPQVVDFMMSNALSDSTYVRENVKRFAISYPTDDMQRRVDEAFLRSNRTTVDYARDLGAHFAYNKGVYQAISAQEGGGSADMYRDALEDLEKAETLAEDLTQAKAQTYTKVDYAKGWVKALGTEAQASGSEFTMEAAQKDLENFIDKVDSAKGDYAYPWQVDAARSYLNGDTAAFK